MSRMFSVLLTSVLLFSSMAFLTVATSVQAVTTYQFNATSLGDYADFSLRYVDTDGDHHFSENE